jgi:hypothetical protein
VETPKTRKDSGTNDEPKSSKTDFEFEQMTCFGQMFLHSPAASKQVRIETRIFSAKGVFSGKNSFLKTHNFSTFP